jgi:hypothetical protein
MPVLPGDIADVVASYLASVDRQKYDDVVRDRQFSTFARDFVHNSTVKQDVKKAVTYRVEFMNSGYNNTRAKFIDSSDAPNRGPVSSYGTQSMCFQDTHMIVNKLEPSFTGGSDDEVINYLDLHLANMYDRWFEYNDNRLFTLATAPNDNPPVYNSIPYYVVPYTTTSPFGFNGSNPSGYSAVDGIDRSTAANAGHRNGTGEYTTVDQMDFCRLAAEAYQKCNFSPYHNVKKDRASENVPEQRFKFYSDFTLWQEYQDIAYTSNDNIGEDQGKYRGGKRASDNTFMSNSWSWVPARLENGAEVATIGTRYFYGLDLSTWQIHKYGDWFMKFEKNAIRLEDSHNSLVSWMDSGFQLHCRNGRSNFVLTPAN